MKLDLFAGAADLTAQLVDIESVSGAEGPIADAIEAALRPLPHLTVERDGHAVVARTGLGLPRGLGSGSERPLRTRRRAARLDRGRASARGEPGAEAT